ncbi:GNAT family N-acetyltransferase [Nocardia sp. NPDC057030]|uniref:GNAT family N-acetyltransferase n=1 Tax=unclassified Nocardia TaxID=2637762 RepID=UPI0036357C1E
MSAPIFTFRPAGAHDQPFLELMLLEAANASGNTLTRDTLPGDEHTYRYVAGWGRESDIGVVALDEHGARAGAAWARLFDATTASPAFVGEAIPEITIAVAPAFRRRRLGAALLAELATRARAAGITGLSLGVETNNVAAQQLYRRDGWSLHRTAGDYIILVKDLRTPA